MKKTKENQAKEILIIEEQSIVSLDLQKKLERNGYQVQTANSFERADSDVNPDLVVADSAPKNASFFHRMKSVLIGQSLPIICTGNMCMDGFKKVIEFKIIANFFKPFDSQDILNKINQYFKKKMPKLTKTQHEKEKTNYR